MIWKILQCNPALLIDELLCTVANGGGVRIGWYAPEALTGVRLLRAHGVRCWGGGFATNPDRRWVMVRPAQARWAAGLLMGAGYVIFEGPTDARPIQPRTNWGAPAPGQGLNGVMEAVFLSGYRPRTTWGAPAPAQGLAGFIVGLFGQPFGGTRRREGANRGR